MARNRQTLRRVITAVVAVLLLLGVVGWLIACHVARARLVAAAREQLGAELEIGSVWYRPPLGLRLRNARLIVPIPGKQSVDVLECASLAVDLGGMPGAG